MAFDILGPVPCSGGACRRAFAQAALIVPKQHRRVDRKVLMLRHAPYVARLERAFLHVNALNHCSGGSLPTRDSRLWWYQLVLRLRARAGITHGSLQNAPKKDHGNPLCWHRGV